MIEVKGLYKDFGALHVLRGVSLNVEQGDIISIIGPSGSGKSTLLRSINLLEKPTYGEIWVEGMHISPYDQGNIFNRDPMRPKKLLMHKSEIRKLDGLVSRQGYTLVPLEIYLKDGRMKLQLGLCRGKAEHDKRDTIAKRDADRDIRRALREHNK